MESLFFALGFLGILALIGGSIFFLGYNTARSKNAKHHRVIQESYRELIAEQRRLADTDGHKAYRKGWREGYTQGLEDLHGQLKAQMVDND